MPSSVYWDGSAVVYRHVTFKMESLSEMLHCIVGELGRTMGSLLLLASSDSGGGGGSSSSCLGLGPGLDDPLAVL